MTTAVIAVLTACAVFTPFDTFHAYNIQPMDAPAAATPELWDALLTCAGSRAREGAALERIRWYRVTKIIRTADGSHRHGMWIYPHSIYLVDYQEGNVLLIGHEMLHDILGAFYAHEHPAFARCDPLELRRIPSW